MNHRVFIHSFSQLDHNTINDKKYKLIPMEQTVEHNCNNYVITKYIQKNCENKKETPDFEMKTFQRE